MERSVRSKGMEFGCNCRFGLEVPVKCIAIQGAIDKQPSSLIAPGQNLAILTQRGQFVVFLRSDTTEIRVNSSVFAGPSAIVRHELCFVTYATD